MKQKERTYQINNSSFTIVFDNVINSNAEVIVSSDDNYISMGGGVSASIKKHAGDYIIKDTQKNTPCELGDVIVTSAGDLRQKYIFHCITLLLNDRGKRMRPQSTDVQIQVIHNCLEKCFRLLPILGISSIALTPIGTKVARYTLDEVASKIAESVTSFCFRTNKKYIIELYISNNDFGFDIMDYVVFFEETSKKIHEFKLNHDHLSFSNATQDPQNHNKGHVDKAIDIEQEPKQIFISYSRANSRQASLFCDMLDKMGHSYWIDIEGNYSGRNFKEEIVDAIEKASLILFLSSKESNRSKNVVKEISLAVSLNKNILPVKLDDSQYAKSVRFDLSDIDWIDFNIENQDKAFDKFNNCISILFQNYDYQQR